MANETLKRDQNNITVLGAVTDNASQEIVMLRVDPTTKRLLVSATGGGGSGGNIDSINNDATADQVFSVDDSGTDVNIDDQGNGIHVINIPSASLTARGVVTTDAQTFAGVKTFSDLPLLPSTVPTLSNQAITKGYVDTFAQGLTVKQSCTVATTANITLSGEQTIDGILTSSSRVLVKNQTNGTENGIYVTGAGAWTRATDYDQTAEVQAGTFTAVLQGTTQEGTLWVQTTQNPTLGSSSLVFSQLASVTGGIGTVTNVSVVTNDGVSGNVTNPTTTPAITLSLGTITPDAITSSGAIRSDTSFILKETGGGTDTITIQAPSSVTSSYTLTLPADDGTSGQFLQTNGSGTLTWAASTSSPQSFAGAQPLTGVAYPRVVGSNLAIGDTDLYTVPAGKRALINTQVRAYNTSAGNITYFTQFKSGGAYYRIGADTTVTTASGSISGGPGYEIVLNAGDILAVNTTTNSGLNISYVVIEFDDTSALYSPRVLSMSNGNNTVYTVPSGKNAFGYRNTTVNGNTGVNIVNDSGASRNYLVYNVPNGGSVGTTNQIQASTAVSDNTSSLQSINATLDSGDFIVVNTSSGTANQTAWVTVYEVDA